MIIGILNNRAAVVTGKLGYAPALTARIRDLDTIDDAIIIAKTLCNDKSKAFRKIWAKIGP